MIYELRNYLLQPGKQPEFLAHALNAGLRVRQNDYGQLRGYWTSELGLLNQVFHLWSFPSIEERSRLLAELARREQWTRDYLPKARSMMLKQESTILSPAFELDAPAEGPNVYELRRYVAHPGKVPEWLALFKEAAPARRKLSRIVGAWTSEIGQLNQLVHLWSYRDLNERASVRRQSMQDAVWMEFLKKVPPLIMQMESTILNPAPFSPLK